MARNGSCGCECGEACGCGRACACGRRGSGAAGVVAKGLTLLLLGVGAGAAHSVLKPITLRMTETAPLHIALPNRPVTQPGTTDSNHAGTAEPGTQPGVVPGSEGDPGGVRVPGAEPEQLVLEKYLTLEQTRLLWEGGMAQFIDARHRDEFVAGHIPRSILLDPDEMYAGRMPDELGFVDQAGIVVIYCGGGECDASENAGRFLQQMGFTQLHIFKDGFPAWDGAGMSVDVGEPGASVPR